MNEVWVGDGELRRRYVVCHNPEEVTRRRIQRARVLEHLEAELSVYLKVRYDDREDASKAARYGSCREAASLPARSRGEG